MATQAYNAIIATITVASGVSNVTKTMAKSTTWREGTSGAWRSVSCILTAGKVYQFRTPLSGMSSSSTAILPNIKADVVVDWDTTAIKISTVSDNFMAYYADGCNALTALGAPDTSGLSGSVGDIFMTNYARGCSQLTTLGVPDTSGLSGSVGTDFMYYYAGGCNALTALGVPDTSGLTSVGNFFMRYYAEGCNALTALILPSATGYFAGTNVNWSVPSGRNGYLYGYAPTEASQSAWQALTASGKTLYTNYIRAAAYVLVQAAPEPEGVLRRIDLTGGMKELSGGML